MISLSLLGNCITYSAKSFSPSAHLSLATAYSSFSDFMLCFIIKSQSSKFVIILGFFDCNCFGFFAASFNLRFDIDFLFFNIGLNTLQSTACFDPFQGRMSRTMENFFVFLRDISVCTYTHAVLLVRLTKIHHGIVLTDEMFLWGTPSPRFGQLEGCMVMLAISSVLFFTDSIVVHTVPKCFCTGFTKRLSCWGNLWIYCTICEEICPLWII